MLSSYVIVTRQTLTHFLPIHLGIIYFNIVDTRNKSEYKSFVIYWHQDSTAAMAMGIGSSFIMFMDAPGIDIVHISGSAMSYNIGNIGKRY